MLRFVPFADVRTNFGLRKFTNASAEQFLIFGQAEVHELSVPLQRVQASGFGRLMANLKVRTTPETMANLKVRTTPESSADLQVCPALSNRP